MTPFAGNPVAPARHTARPLRVLSVVGTRPEVIKMAPVIAALRREPSITSAVCAVGQHREMLGQALEAFSIASDFACDVMRPGQGLSSLTAALFPALDQVVDTFQPDWVLAQGDTTTVMVASLVSFYRRLAFGHVEAGLRTRDLGQPFPEELNRRIADLVAHAYFTPTWHARAALLAEGCSPGRIHVTGNTIVDALTEVSRRPYDWRDGPLARIDPARPIVLITAHRRESFGAPMRELCSAIAELAASDRGRAVQFVFPVHLNPQARTPAHEQLGNLANVFLLEPLDYVSMIHAMRRAQFVLTDSGGIQEEAPCFGVPVLVMRDTTERPEGFATGLIALVGTNRHRIISEAERLLQTRRMASAEPGPSPYGDGQAAGRIVAILKGEPAPIPTLFEVSCPV